MQGGENARGQGPSPVSTIELGITEWVDRPGGIPTTPDASGVVLLPSAIRSRRPCCTRALRYAGPASTVPKLMRRRARNWRSWRSGCAMSLRLTVEEVADWTRALQTLLVPPHDPLSSVEARLLYDLQKACVEHERRVHRTSVWRWILSRGKRPCDRPLPLLGNALTLRHLRRAHRRVSATRLDVTAVSTSPHSLSGPCHASNRELAIAYDESSTMSSTRSACSRKMYPNALHARR